jgi:hypothetical protein
MIGRWTVFLFLNKKQRVDCDTGSGEECELSGYFRRQCRYDRSVKKAPEHHGAFLRFLIQHDTASGSSITIDITDISDSSRGLSAIA